MSVAGSRPVAFRWERDMIPCLVDALHQWLPAGWPATICEVSCPSGGIPDVVAMTVDGESVETRLSRGLGPVIDVVDMQVLRALPDVESIPLRDLSQAVMVSRGHLRRVVLPRLVKSGWVKLEKERVTDPQVSARFRHIEVATRIVTVEAKRRDWRQGLHQALRHASSSDMALLAMDAASAKVVSGYTDEISRLGVGLVTVDALTGSVSTLSRPTTSLAAPVMRAVLIERAWALHLAGSTSGPTFTVFGRDLTAAAP